MTSNKTFTVGEQFCMRAQFCRFTGKMFCAQRSIREHFCDEMGPYSVYLLLRSVCDVRLVYLSDHFTRSDRLVVTQDLGYICSQPLCLNQPRPLTIYILSFFLCYTRSHEPESRKCSLEGLCRVCPARPSPLHQWF